MKKLLIYLISLSFVVIGLTGCEKTINTGVSLETFLSRYTDYREYDDTISELYDITLADATVREDDVTKQTVYSFIFGRSEDLDRTAAEMTVNTDKKDCVNSVIVNMDELGLIYYTAGGTQIESLMAYYTSILLSLTDLSVEEAVGSMRDLFNQEGTFRRLEINNMCRMTLRFGEAEHTLGVYVNKTIH